MEPPCGLLPAKFKVGVSPEVLAIGTTSTDKPDFGMCAGTDGLKSGKFLEAQAEASWDIAGDV